MLSSRADFQKELPCFSASQGSFGKRMDDDWHVKIAMLLQNLSFLFFLCIFLHVCQWSFLDLNHISWRGMHCNNVKPCLLQRNFVVKLCHSFSFFFTFILGHWFGLTKISKQHTNQFVMFLKNLLGNIHMFLFTIPVYNSVLATFLERIHPESLALSALLWYLIIICLSRIWFLFFFLTSVK